MRVSGTLPFSDGTSADWTTEAKGLIMTPTESVISQAADHSIIELYRATWLNVCNNLLKSSSFLVSKFGLGLF